MCGARARPVGGVELGALFAQARRARVVVECSCVSDCAPHAAVCDCALTSGCHARDTAKSPTRAKNVLVFCTETCLLNTHDFHLRASREAAEELCSQTLTCFSLSGGCFAQTSSRVWRRSSAWTRACRRCSRTRTSARRSSTLSSRSAPVLSHGFHAVSWPCPVLFHGFHALRRACPVLSLRELES